jgi:hypothetical protein
MIESFESLLETLEAGDLETAMLIKICRWKNGIVWNDKYFQTWVTGLIRISQK